MSASPSTTGRLTLLAILSAALLFGCAAPEKKPTGPQRPPAAPKPGPAAPKPGPAAAREFPRWETRTFERHFGLCDDAPNDCARVSFSYPVSPRETKTPADEAVDWFVEEHLLGPAMSEIRQPDMETLAAEFVHAYEQVKQDLKDYRSYWYLDREVSILHVDDRVVSLCFTEAVHTGGAHPNAFRRYQSFDLKTGRPVVIEDLVLPGARRKLTAVAAERFRELVEIPPGVSLTDAGFWFENGRFRLNDNFALVGDDLLFYYNLYEITSYARGPTALRIPFPALTGVLKPRWTE